MFERIAKELEQLNNGEIETLSISAVDADLTEFFANTNLRSRKKINKALKSSGLEIVTIKHRPRMIQSSRFTTTTYVTYYINADFAQVRKQRIYSNTW